MGLVNELIHSAVCFNYLHALGGCPVGAAFWNALKQFAINQELQIFFHLCIRQVRLVHDPCLGNAIKLFCRDENLVDNIGPAPVFPQGELIEQSSSIKQPREDCYRAILCVQTRNAANAVLRAYNGRLKSRLATFGDTAVFLRCFGWG